MNAKGNFIRTEDDGSKYYRTKRLNEEKIGMVREVIRKEFAFNDLYGRESIDSKLFDKCTRDFIETEKGCFVHNVKSEVTSFEINHLKNQNILLKQLIIELSHENHMLKQNLLKVEKGKVSFQ